MKLLDLKIDPLSGASPQYKVTARFLDTEMAKTAPIQGLVLTFFNNTQTPEEALEWLNHLQAALKPNQVTCDVTPSH